MAQRTITTQGVLIINGQPVANTFRDLSQRTRKLIQELKNLTPGTQEFIDKAEELRQVRAHFQAVRDEIFATNQEIEKSEGIIGKAIKAFGGLGGLFTIGTSVSLVSTTQELLKISDAITDVQKTSGLAQSEVEALWKEFSNFDTRTSKLELMNIAQIGGRLGITDKEQLQEFTREIDKIYVALGDSFQGGLEEVTTKVGKLKNLFEETKNSDYGSALNEIGSALNELGANGTASESNITEFATRIGQLPNALKPAIDKTLGLGAAFEESGIDAQIASSGYSRFVSVAGNNLEGFAKQMKITKEEATELFRTKPEEFFIKFGESMKGIPADKTTKILKDLDLNTLEIKKSLGAAGDNADRFREMMQLSSKAMTDATSIQNEFNQKNENAAAIWEKMGRAIKDFITDGAIPEFFNWITNIIGYITGVISETGNGIERFRARLGFLVKTLAVVTTAVLSYRAAVWLATITTKGAWQQTVLYNAAIKAQTAFKKVAAAATHLFSAAKLALMGNTQRATVAMRAFNIAVRANPIGLLVTTITTAITAFALFSKKQKELTAQQVEAVKELQKEATQLNTLRKMIADNNIPLEKRKELIEKLKEKYPDYLKDIKNEGNLTKELADKLDLVNKHLILKARLKANEPLIEEQTQITAAAQEKLDKAERLLSDTIYSFRDKAYMDRIDNQLKGKSLEEQTQKIIDYHIKLNRGNLTASLKTSLKMFEEAKGVFEEENKKLSELLSLNASLEQKYKIETPTATPPTTPDDGDGGNKPKDPKKYKGDVYGQAQRELLKAQRDFIKKQQELEDEETAVLQDSLDKQLSAVETKYERKKLALQQENEDFINEIKELNKKIREANEKIADKETSDEEKADNRRAIGVYKKIIAEKRNLIEQNNKMEITLESTKNHELNTTREKYFTKQLDKEVKSFEKKINLRKAQSELEIAQIRTLEEAKEKLQAQGYEGQLHKIRTLEEAKKELKKQADKAILQETLKSLEAQQQLLTEGIKSVSGESAEKLIADLEKLEEKILQIKTAIATGETPDKSSIKGTEAENVDILGFTAGQWEDVFQRLDTTEGKIQAIGMAMQGLANAGQLFSEIQKASNDKELASFERMQNKKRESHKRQLDQGTMSQERYNKEQERMDKELANKKAELAHKQAKAEKTARLFSAIGSVAQAVAQALTAGPIMGPILAGIVGALGAVQVGIIASQPLPEKQSYAKGGFTKGIGFADNSGHEVAGVVHANEYVIPEWLLKDPQVANVAHWLEARRIGNRQEAIGNSGFAEGGYTSQTAISPENPLKTTDSELTQRLLNVLEKIERDGVEAHLISDAKNGKKMQKAIKEYTNLVNKNTH